MTVQDDSQALERGLDNQLDRLAHIGQIIATRLNGAVLSVPADKVTVHRPHHPRLHGYAFNGYALKGHRLKSHPIGTATGSTARPRPNPTALSMALRVAVNNALAEGFTP